MCPPLPIGGHAMSPTTLPYIVIQPRLTNPSGLSWRVPNFDIRNRLNAL